MSFRVIRFGIPFFKPKHNVLSQKRDLSFHEYVGMELLRNSKINVARGFVAASPDEAFQKAKEFNFKDYVIKAQVLAGGRGKGHFKDGLKSGIFFAGSADKVKEISSGMIGQNLITKQTGEAGLVCNKVYVCERLYPRREFYVAFTLDRVSQGPILIGSAAGGVNIEETSAKDPSSLIRLPVDINKGLSSESVVDFLEKLDFSSELIPEATEQIKNAYNVFITRDLTLLELNPFCETHNGHVYAMDCKLQLDDNAIYRQEELANQRDFSQEKKLDVRAAKSDINYIALDGNVGCLVNGAGLAMATLDIIKLHGGSPANFLDVGGGATIEQVLTAFEIILSDKNVKAILVNIFGGIMRCDIIAQGIIEAAKTLDISVPLVVRLQGTKIDEAKMLFLESKLRIISIDDLEDASQMVVKLASIVQIAHAANIDVKFELPI